ncbi:MAG: hypothetical protein ABIO63_05220 [Casimicrobiaceae bacterium]
MNSFNTAVEPAAAKAHNTVDSAVSKAGPVVDKAAELAHRTINRVADAAAPAADWALQSGQQVTAKYNSALDTCAATVRERPIAIVAGALLLGYLVGRFQR